MTDRIAQIRAEMAAEAAERERRLTQAMMMGATVAKGTGRGVKNHNPQAVNLGVAGKAARYEAATANLVDRDPCGFCNVRRDLHDELGCKRWRALG